jgi:hypothetical protein
MNMYQNKKKSPTKKSKQEALHCLDLWGTRGKAPDTMVGGDPGGTALGRGRSRCWRRPPGGAARGHRRRDGRTKEVGEGGLPTFTGTDPCLGAWWSRDPWPTPLVGDDDGTGASSMGGGRRVVTQLAVNEA